VLFKGRDKNGLLEESKLNETASGFVGNASGNPAHLAISSVAMEQMWTALEKITNLNQACFVDFGMYCLLLTSSISIKSSYFQ
jgi:hypothetical protein